MNTRLKKMGMVIALAAMPLMTSTVSAQAVPAPMAQGTGVSVIFSDAPGFENSSNYTFGLNQFGILEGQVASIDAATRATTGMAGLNVFFVQNGQVIKQAKTGQNGSFEIMGINEGAYSFFATGKSGFAAYGVYVSAQEAARPNVLEATLASANYYGIQQLLKNNVPAQVTSTVSMQAQNTGAAAALESAPQIQLINGRLRGKINSIASSNQSIAGVHVHIIQNDQPIAQVQTDDQGRFVVPDLTPGVYDLVAAGEKGFAAGRFEAIGKSVMSQVSFANAPELEYTLTQGDDNDGGLVVEPSYEVPGQYAGESVTLGGASGGSSGAANNFSNFSGNGVVRGRFGGRGAGFGRFRAGGGRLLLLGGLAGGLATIGSGNPDDSSPDGS